MVAKTILAQLGGNKFVLMTGAKQLIDLGNGLQFKLPSTREFVRQGINCVRVVLEASDTYTVEFFKIGKAVKTIATHSDVYAENLAQIFRAETGLDTSL
jgi:ribonucleotide monophosphatase NagD (HAD superfamily)